MNQRPRPNISEVIASGEADRAMARGIRLALLRHKRLGESVAVWQDGKAILIPADQIPITEEDLDKPMPQA